MNHFMTFDGNDFTAVSTAYIIQKAASWCLRSRDHKWITSKTHRVSICRLILHNVICSTDAQTGRHVLNFDVWTPHSHEYEIPVHSVEGWVHMLCVRNNTSRTCTLDFKYDSPRVPMFSARGQANIYRNKHEGTQTWVSSCCSSSHFLMPLSLDPLNSTSPCTAKHSMPS